MIQKNKLIQNKKELNIEKSSEGELASGLLKQKIFKNAANCRHWY